MGHANYTQIRPPCCFLVDKKISLPVFQSAFCFVENVHFVVSEIFAERKTATTPPKAVVDLFIAREKQAASLPKENTQPSGPKSERVRPESGGMWPIRRTGFAMFVYTADVL